MKRWQIGVLIMVALWASAVGVRSWEARANGVVVDERCLETARGMDNTFPWAYFNGPAWMYMPERTLIERLRLHPGERMLGAQRESMAQFARSIRKKPNYGPCTILPAHEVWVIRIGFSGPQRFISALFASGIATYVYDAVTGNSVEGVIKGKFISGPPFSHRRAFHAVLQPRR